MDEILADLGLTPLEIKIFKLLLYEGPNQAGKISRLTGIHRRNVYDALERLIQKGLVSYIKENNKRQYVANNPSIVLDKLKSKQQEWEKIMPELHARMELWQDKKETLFFKGINGVKHIFLDQVNIGKEVLVFATNADVTEVIKYFLPKYQTMRKEKKIPTRMLFDKTIKQSDQYKRLQKLPLCKLKILDRFNTTKASQYIYGDNVAVVVWSEDPFAILIRHSEIAQSARERFEILWKAATK